MKASNRQHPLLSPIGCLAAIAIVVGLAAAVFVSGGAVFSPGPLTALATNGEPLNGFASHAGFENDCNQCHTPFRGVEAARCENCHANVADQRATGNGLHGGIPVEDVARCEACHSDHKGRDFNSAAVTLTNFDHAVAGFALTTHQQLYDGADFACQSCHTGQGFAFAEQTCTECHAQADAKFMAEHVQSFGENCLGCHDGTGNLANFDHSAFPLEGKHASVECKACHINKVFKGTSSECVACHAEPEMHVGLFGTDCAACHTANAWSPARFDRPHTFPLDHGEQGLLACATCHVATLSEFTCYQCHEQAEMIGKHSEEGIPGSRLENCVECHATGQKEEGEHEGGDG